MKEWRKIHDANTNQNKAGVAILVSTKQTSEQGKLSEIKRHIVK